MTAHEQAEVYRGVARSLRAEALKPRQRRYANAYELSAQHQEKIADDLETGACVLWPMAE